MTPTQAVQSIPRGLDVIVVEDVAENAELLAELVKAYGHQVRVAGHGHAALEMVAHQAPDLVILDVGLPDIDGYEVAARMRARLGKGPRIVALSGFGGRRARDSALRAGCDAYLEKPFRAADLRVLLGVGAKTLPLP
jgi:CheY-like chemotaxis protein